MIELGLATTRELLTELQARGTLQPIPRAITVGRHVTGEALTELATLATYLLDRLPLDVLDYRSIDG